ncbi:MAG: hypothetical protein SWZ49_28990 [Cyanobacteriota bacterium]|nr:hypothetical protein [Cyanobacteriota bacterium]
MGDWELGIGDWGLGIGNWGLVIGNCLTIPVRSERFIALFEKHTLLTKHHHIKIDF